MATCSFDPVPRLNGTVRLGGTGVTMDEWINAEMIKIREERLYKHFDARAMFSVSDVQQMVSVERLSNHSFWPFLRSKIAERRHREDKATGRIYFEPKPRPICYASHKDAIVFSWLNWRLQQGYEGFISGSATEISSIAYRELGKSTPQFVLEVARHILRQPQSVAVVSMDISGFFDSLNHDLLLERWGRVLAQEVHHTSVDAKLAKYLTSYDYVSKERLLQLMEDNGMFPDKGRICQPFEFRHLKKLVGGTKLVEKNINTFGIPQGSPASATLSNIYMIDFDARVNEYAANQAVGMYRRYSDDILVVCQIDEVDSMVSFLTSLAEANRLTINESKTQIRYFIKNGPSCLCFDQDKLSDLDYLGILFDGNRFLLRGATLARYHRKLKRAARQAVYYQKKAGFAAPPRRQMYKRFSAYGDQNFLTYAQGAAEILNSPNIRRQINDRKAIMKIQASLLQAGIAYEQNEDE